MKMSYLTTSIGSGIVIACLSLILQGALESPSVDNAELERMYQEDQADRNPGPQGIDWDFVGPRDDSRLKRTRELYEAGALLTGVDWYRAALIMQHSNEPNDYLLAHEMSVAALAKGEPRGRWLAAASEDRFLMSIGREQRFGTQYLPAGEEGNFRLAPTDKQVTDELRAALNAPSLAEAMAKAERFNKK